MANWLALPLLARCFRVVHEAAAIRRDIWIRLVEPCRQTNRPYLLCCRRVVREAAAMLLRQWGSNGDGTRGSPEPLQLMGGLAGDMVTPRSLLGSGADAAETDDGPSAATNIVTPNVPMGEAEGIDPLEAANRVTPNNTVTVTMLAVQLPQLEGQPSPPTVDFAILVHDLLRDEHCIEVRMRTELLSCLGLGLGVGRAGICFPAFTTTSPPLP